MNPMLKLQIETAGPVGLVTVLYRELERSLHRTIRLWARASEGNLPWEQQKGELEAASAAAQRATAIILHLLGTLDASAPGAAEFAARMEALYLRWIQVITAAQLQRDQEALRGILPEIKTVREGWEQLSASNPVA